MTGEAPPEPAEPAAEPEPPSSEQPEPPPPAKPATAKPARPEPLTWDAFWDRAAELAIPKQVDATAFAAGMQRLLVNLGKAGKEQTVTSATLDYVLSGIRDGRFVWATGKVTKK